MNLTFNKTNFQGHKLKKNQDYFEGWYFKQTTIDNSVICFIPGVSLNLHDSHAFIQCIYKDQKHNHQTYYFKYPLSQFSYTNKPFTVSIGNNFFSKNKIIIDINDDKIIRGKIKFIDTIDLNRSLLNPNIMGFFSYLPNLECRHEIVSMNHFLKGKMNIEKKEINFDYGKGYIEKDWGSSFPTKYIWLQANNFKEAEISLCFSIARVPIFKTEIEGFFGNLLIKEKQYRFATYNHSKATILKCDDEGLSILIKNHKYTLQISGQLADGEELWAPRNGKMAYKIKETLTMDLHLILKNASNQIIIDTISSNCGIEIVNYK